MNLLLYARAKIPQLDDTVKNIINEKKKKNKSLFIKYLKKYKVFILF